MEIGGKIKERKKERRGNRVVSFHFRNRERKDERNKERKKERMKEEGRGWFRFIVLSFHFGYGIDFLENRIQSTQIRFISVDCPQLANLKLN
jgi:hypothetical protein